MRATPVSWSVCIVLSALLIGVELRTPGKRFLLLPIPSRSPRKWIYSFALLFQVFPWIMVAVFIIPLSSIVMAIVARRSAL